MILFNEYELKPLCSGQICVTEGAGGVLGAYRSVAAGEQGLAWAPIAADELDSRAAIIGFCTFTQHVANGVWVPQCAVTLRQLAQLVAHRTAIVAGSDAEAGEQPLARIAQLAIEDILGATLGQNITQALRELTQLGLDIGEGRDRQALQIVINLAEQNSAGDMLDDLQILPKARNGFVNAMTWLRSNATPQLLNSIADLAAESRTARLLITPRRTKSSTLAHTTHLKSARDA